MIVPDPKRYTHSDENLLPMINIIFLLLIFFMVAGVIAASDQLDLTPIKSQAGNETGIDTQALLLSADGRLVFGDTPATLDHNPQVLKDLLNAGYQQWRENMPDAADDTPLPVKMDANVTSAQLAKLMRMLEAAGIKKIRVMAESMDSAK